MERGGSSLSALDGLRGVAAFAVLLSHCAFAFLPYLHTGNPAQLRYAWEESVFNSPFYLYYSGGFAVSLFFVLSGFVLARKFLLRGNIDDLRASAQKRYARLGIPVLGSVLLGYLLMSLQAIPQAPHGSTIRIRLGQLPDRPGSLGSIETGSIRCTAFWRHQVQLCSVDDPA